ncbi:MAG: GEVED domain-containing protein [Bacteroidota bacterium]
MKTITSLVVFFFTALLTYGQTTLIDFDNDDNWVASSAGALSSYQDDHSYSDGVFSATAVDALRQGNGDQDGFPGALGDYSWRLRNNTDTSWEATIASGGVEDFSVAIRRWDDSPSPDYNLEYSVDNGDSWEFVALIDNASLGESSDWTTFSGTIESDVDDILIRIVPNSSGERIMIDDFEWTEFSAAATGSGETCDDAFVINNLPYTDSQDTADFSSDYVGDDVPDEDENTQIEDGTGTTTYLSGNDVVYEFTPEESSVYNINLQATEDGWSGLYLFQDCNPFTTLIGYSTETGGDTRALEELDLIGGETYYIVVSSWESSTATVDYVLDVSELTCPVPTDLEVTDTSTDSVDFSWELAPNESNGYEYVVMPAGLNPIDDASEIVSSGSVASGETTATVSGLDDATPYDLYLRAECEADDFSDYISTSFTTECEAVSEFSEDFDDTETEELPVCWSNIINSSNEYIDAFVESSSVNSYTEPNMLQFYNAGDAEAELFVTSPIVNNIADNTHWLTFYAKESGGVLEVGTMTDPQDESTFSLVETVALTSDHEKYEVPFDNDYTGDHIAFRVTFEGTYDYLRIDNVVWEEIQNCFAPENLEVTGFGLDFVELSWDAIDNPANQDAYVCYVFEEGADPETDTPVATGTTDDLNIVVDGLTENTSYDAYISSDCGDDGLSNLPELPVSFYTGYCVSEPSSNDGDGVTQVVFQDQTFDSAGADATLEDFTGTTVDIQQAVTANMDITFATGYTYDVHIWIDFNDNLEFEENELVFSGESTNDDPTTFDASFDVPLDANLGEHRMRIGTADSGQSTPNPCYSGSYGVTMEFNVNVLEAPSCNSPSGLEIANTTFNGTDLSWDAVDNPADQDAYTWYVFEEGDDPEVDTPVATGTTDDLNVTIADELDADTNYEAYISVDCGADGESSLSNPVSFLTGYCIPSSSSSSTYVDNFTTSSGVSNISNLETGFSDGGYADNTSLNVTSFEDGSFDFTAEIVGGSAGFSIWVDWNQDLIFDNEEEKVFNTTSYGNGPFTGTIQVPEGTPDGDYRMRITTDWGASNPSLPCDDRNRAEFEDYTITVGPAPSCLIPENFQVSVISEDSAELSWDAVDNPADQDAYTWYVFEEGDDPEVDTPVATGSTNDLNAVVDDLLADTAYEAYISADCGADGESDLSSSISFYTGACQDAGPTSASDTHITSLELTGNDETGIDIPDNCPDQTGIQNESDIEVVLSAGLSYDFNVGIGSCTGAMYSNAGEVWVDFDSSLTFDQEESVASWSSTSIESIQNLTIDIPDDVEPGQYRMRVMQKEFGSLPLDPCESYGYGSVIDFIVNIVPAPSCSVVENVSLDETTTTTATFSWDAVDDAESYDWVIVEEGDDVSDEANHINSGNVSEATVTVDGLEVTTDYDFYVQSNCGEDLVSDFADAVNFTTETPEFASVQLIHNSPDPAAEFVDVYVDGELAVEDFQFRTATEFLPILAEEEITVDIVPAGDDISNSVFTYTATLLADETYIVVANGALDPANFDDSVNGNIDFGFDIYEGAQTTSANADEVDVLVHHGSLDAPMVSVEETGQGAGMLVTDISYTEFDGYLSVAEDDYELDILDETGEILYRYEANLEELQLANTAITVIASGVLGVDEESEEFFGLWAALPSGGALVELEMIELSSEEFNSENFSYYPNPVESNLQVRAANTIEKVEIFNTLGQRLSTERPNNASPSINMSNLQSGVYLMKVTIEGATESFQVIKK